MTIEEKNQPIRERRKLPRQHDWLFKVVIALNVIAWGLMVVALILYHQGKPEMVTGLHQYWGIEGREEWIQTYYDWLVILLQCCLILSLVSLLLRAARSRRKQDHLGFNLFLLIVIIAISLVTLMRQ